MNPLPRRLLALFVALAATAAVAQAHPGHDGHELTWDLQHLAEHPLATAGCGLFLAVAAWVVWRLARRRHAAPDQSLRASQASRGK